MGVYASYAFEQGPTELDAICDDCGTLHQNGTDFDGCSLCPTCQDLDDKRLEALKRYEGATFADTPYGLEEGPYVIIELGRLVSKVRAVNSPMDKVLKIDTWQLAEY